MSRPPRPSTGSPVAGDGSLFEARGEFMPLDFDELAKLAREYAASDAGLLTTAARGAAAAADGGRGRTEPRGDFAETLIGASALLAQTLGLYQNLYARESFLGTAQLPRSLVLHGRRLAYEPDQGLAATGHVVLTIAPGLAGKLRKGFSFASAPRGVVKAQTFETLEDVDVDAARNEMLPHGRTRPARLVFRHRAARFRLRGKGLGLEIGALGVLSGPGVLIPVEIVSAKDDPRTDETLVRVKTVHRTWPVVPSPHDLAAAADGSPTFRFFAMPKATLRRFGWDADPVQFPTDEIDDAGVFTEHSGVGYDVVHEDGAGLHLTDVFLSAAEKTDFVGGLVVTRVDGRRDVLRVVRQDQASVAFRKVSVVPFNVIDAAGNEHELDQGVEARLSATTTCLRLTNALGQPVNRPRVALQTTLLGDWAFQADVLPTEPNHVKAAPEDLELDADLSAVAPGTPLAFETLDGAAAQIVTTTSIRVLASGRTSISWAGLKGAPPGRDWFLDDLRVAGNVARASHGASADEILGGSDGLTPFQRFALKQSPVTQVPGIDGGEPEIEVRVGGVAWTAVGDFAESGPKHRHYRLEHDEEHRTFVVFGDGVLGAIPPAGRKNVTVSYRVGLGPDGDVDAGAASRIKKADPLVRRVHNPTPVAGGAGPARPADLKRQATRYLRTFDRAVSLQDHADLALLFPGVARASAAFDARGVIVVHVADEHGESPGALAELQAFLDARRDTTTPLRPEGPQPVDVRLDLDVEHDPAYLPDVVRRAVETALVGEDPDAPGLFAFAAREFGQPAYPSEVYARVASVEGATGTRVTRFRIGNHAGVRDVLPAGPRQWLRLLPSNLKITPLPRNGA